MTTALAAAQAEALEHLIGRRGGSMLLDDQTYRRLRFAGLDRLAIERAIEHLISEGHAELDVQGPLVFVKAMQ